MEIFYNVVIVAFLASGSACLVAALVALVRKGR
jgi:hypothetical protein